LEIGIVRTLGGSIKAIMVCIWIIHFFNLYFTLCAYTVFKLRLKSLHTPCLNLVMYIVDFRTAGYYQKCHDPDCQGMYAAARLMRKICISAN
jgi:hypothetical protein